MNSTADAFQCYDSSGEMTTAAVTNGTSGQALTSNGSGGFGTPVTLGTAALISSTAGGDLSGTLPSPTVAKINGGSVPASAPLLGTNSSSQPISVTTLPTSAEPAHTGDVTNTAGSLAMTVAQIEGGAIPASAGVVGTNSSKQLVSATASSVVGLFSSCSGTQYLGADGNCHTATAGSAAFSGLTGPGTNSTAGNMTLQTGANFIFDYEGIGTTSTDGILLENLTASTSGVTSQYSPRVHWTGQGWKSNSTATNQQVEAFAELEPRSEGAAVESILAFRAILNGSLASGGIGFCNGGSAAVYSGTFITGLDGGSMNCDTLVGFSGFGPVNGASYFGVYTNASERENFTNSGIGFNSTTGLYWGSSTIGNNAVGSVGISYSSSGVLGVDSTALNNGNGNLKAGSFLPSGPINWNGDVIPQAPALALSTSGTNCTAGTHVVAVTYINQFGETVAGTSSSSVTCVASTDQLNVTAIPLGPTGTSGRNVYVSKAGTTTPLYLGCASSPCIGDNTTTSLIVNLADGSLGATSPGSNTTAGMVMQVGGTTVMIGLSNGNVGIGTTSPGKALSVGANLWQADSSGIQWNNPALTTYAGSTSGTAHAAMPFQGSAYKKWYIHFEALNDAGGTLAFPTAFTYAPYCYGDATALAVSSANTTTFTIGVSSSITGNVFCEGR